MVGIFLLLFIFGLTHAYGIGQQNNTNAVSGVNYLQNVFSPRMDFEQWKPLTGRGDPLRNDPTYDYEPPMLDKVHYWIDPSSRKPDDKSKSEVLLLGVSSKKPSVPQYNIKRESVEGLHKLMSSIKSQNFMSHLSRPNMPSRQRPITSHIVFPPISSNKVKYEDYSYKYSENNMPMTILVPPPPPPPVSYHSMTTLDTSLASNPIKVSEVLSTTTHPVAFNKTTEANYIHTSTERSSPHITVEESNLVYQESSSSMRENWNNKSDHPILSVDSNYEGWGPTVSPVTDTMNDTQNFINSFFDNEQIQYSLYRPMFSDIPPPIQTSTTKYPEFPVAAIQTTTTEPIVTTPVTTTSTTFKTTTRIYNTNAYLDIRTTPKPVVLPHRNEPSLLSMLGPMMEMPMIGSQSRVEVPESVTSVDNVSPLTDIELEYMQTMQPPPVVASTEKLLASAAKQTTVRPNHHNTFVSTRSSLISFPTIPTASTTNRPVLEEAMNLDPIFASYIEPKPTVNQGPMYVIIQGHSKVKTYGPKNKTPTMQKNHDDYETKEIQQVKHLHVSKDKEHFKKSDKKKIEKSRNGRTLKALVAEGEGSIDVQEANLGIQFDVSDGSEVPVEIYKKGFVETEENDISKSKKIKPEILKRDKRQIEIVESILPIDPEDIDEYVYNYLKNKSQENTLTGYIASAVTSDAAEVVDELEEAIR